MISDRLPAAYLDNMRKALGEEFEAFLAVYEEPPKKGLRFNTLKARPETIRKLRELWQLRPVPWCPDGYYYEESETVRPGLSPWHEAGVFYIQEPSAMLTAERAGIGPEDIVLDLCAAPGGKSTQAAAKCAFLLSNEPVGARARILSSNIERMGFGNVVVSSAYPDALAAVTGPVFTKIITDAPCSGEGMMRRDETAVREWSPANVELCVRRQREILDAADRMLKAGGRLIYSTCTFEEAENAGQVRAFLARHPDYTLESMETIWPHREEGEGHFCAVLEKRSPAGTQDILPPRLQKLLKKGRSFPDAFAGYLKENGIHILRAGIAGAPQESLRGRKAPDGPSHAQVHAGAFGSVSEDSIELLSEEAVRAYLRGEALDADRLGASGCRLHSAGGWLAVYYDGYALGLGKLSGHTVKNHYPKGLRHR